MPESVSTGERKLEEKSFVHVGNSMYPALRALDQVYVSPIHGDIIKGDIVVFQYSPTDVLIAHRVIYVGSEGIRTMGDNNPKPDDMTLLREMIVGKVTSARRRKRTILVMGGLQGRLWVAVYRAIKNTRVTMESILVKPYHLLAKSGIFRIWLPESLKYKVIKVEKNANVSMILSMSGRTIGRYSTRKRGWLIKPPYKLFIDEASLPGIQNSKDRIDNGEDI